MTQRYFNTFIGIFERIYFIEMLAYFKPQLSEKPDNQLLTKDNCDEYLIVIIVH
jgi:hypothetical protein